MRKTFARCGVPVKDDVAPRYHSRRAYRSCACKASGSVREMVRFRCGLQLRARCVIKSWCLSFINATRRVGPLPRGIALVRFNVKHHQSSAHPWCRRKEEENEKEKRAVLRRVHLANLHFTHSERDGRFYVSFAYILYIYKKKCFLATKECASIVHWYCVQIGIIEKRDCKCCKWFNQYYVSLIKLGLIANSYGWYTIIEFVII